MHNILLVEDEYIVRRGMQSMVEWERYGFHLVDAVNNGSEALEVLEKERVDIVITDVRMPVMDGIALCREIRAREIDCEIVIVSSYDDFDYAKQALQMGVLDYLHKPTLSPEGIAETLRMVAEMRRQKQDTRQLLQAYDESYEIIRKSAIRRLFSNQDSDLLNSLATNERSRTELVWTVLLYCRYGNDSMKNDHPLNRIARRIHELHQDDNRVISAVISEDIIAIFYFGINFDSFFENISNNLVDGQCAAYKYPPVTLTELPGAVERYSGELLDSFRSSHHGSGQNPVVRQALDFISGNYSSHISLADVARSVHITPSYLSRLLMRECHKNFIDLISELRIEQAKRLLSETDFDIERITGLVGYQNSKYFIKAFKRHVKITPGQYRKLQNSEKKVT